MSWERGGGGGGAGAALEVIRKSFTEKVISELPFEEKGFFE